MPCVSYLDANGLLVFRSLCVLVSNTIGYISYYELSRPHQGLNQQTPIPRESAPYSGQVRKHEVLGSIINDYYCAPQPFSHSLNWNRLQSIEYRLLLDTHPDGSPYICNEIRPNSWQFEPFNTNNCPYFLQNSHAITQMISGFDRCGNLSRTSSYWDVVFAGYGL